MFGICFMIKAKELKRQNKIILENELKGSTDKRSQAQTPKSKRKQTTKRRDHRLSVNNDHYSKYKKEMEFEENKKQINHYYEKAIKYFTKSNEINKTFQINKIKIIVISIYICKCYLYLDKKSEAIANIKNALIMFFELNRGWIEMNMKVYLNPRIILLVNGAIIEQILFYIGSINRGIKFKVSANFFSLSLSVSYFKTDNIQSHSCKYLEQILHFQKGRNPTQLAYLEKISNRLSKHAVKKNIFIFFSSEFTKILPTTIEISEIISKCIRNYMSENDSIYCARFDNYRDAQIKKVSEFSKDHIMKILSEGFRGNISNYGMQEAFAYAISLISEEAGKKNGTGSNCDGLSVFDGVLGFQNERAGSGSDNYIFQFILSSDYVFSSKSQNQCCKQGLIDNKVSLYTLIFDIEEAEKEEKEKGINYKKTKKGRIIHSLKQITEGVLVMVNNFSTIKCSFQNISRKYSQKNVFNINCDLCNNIYFDYH